MDCARLQAPGASTAHPSTSTIFARTLYWPMSASVSFQLCFSTRLFFAKASCSLAQSWRNCAFALVPFVAWYVFSCSSVIFRSMAAYSFERVLIPASALCFSAHSSLSSARLSFCDSACSVYFLTVSSHSAIISGNPCGSFVNRSWCVASSPLVEAACSFATNDTLLCASGWRTALKNNCGTQL